MKNLIDIEGIGPKYVTLLHTMGIDSQDELLSVCGKRKGREVVEKQTGISHKLILKWTNQADLARIKGIGEEYAELLERAGVDSASELAHRNAQHLHEALKNKNEEAKLVRKLPALSQIEQWIEEAKTLPKIVHH